MNYLAILVNKNGLSAFLDEIKHHYDLEWNSLSSEACLAVLREIKNDFPLVNGGIISGEKLPYYPLFCIELANQEVINLEKALSEIFNVPFIAKENADTLSPDNLKDAIEQQYHALSWNINYCGFTAGKEEYAIESLLTVANGYLGVRGAMPDMQANDATYPATYLAGCYNQAQSNIVGHMVTNEDFVNAPDARAIRIKIGNGNWLTPETNKNIALYRHLSLKNGVLEQNWLVEDDQKRQIQIRSQILADMSHPTRFAIEYCFTPLNFHGDITISTHIDGETYNYGVARYRSLTSHHYEVLSCAVSGKNAYLNAKTLQSGIGMGFSSAIRGDFFTEKDIHIQEEPNKVSQSITCSVIQGKTYQFEKSVNIRLSTVFPDEWHIADESVLVDFATQLKSTQQAWESLWDKTDIIIDGDLMSQKLLRLHTYHLMCSCSPFSNKDYQLDVSVTARGLHGEAYRGHIFWDEIFILPFYIMHFPQTARQLLMYRYNRLPMARQAAKKEGYEGAMFPWQSGHDGSEQTQVVHLNPLNGEWDPDYSCLQRHVSLAIAYNIWLYWINTKDHKFMVSHGLEMLLEIARFWLSKSQWDETTQRYSISDVMGPDEFHEHTVGSETGGLKDNAYTNLMVSWLFSTLAELHQQFDTHTINTINDTINLNKKFWAKIDHVGKNLSLIIEDDIISQFDGYFDLKEVDWEHYREKYKNIYRMDRILRAEGKSADHYKVAKQADALMIFNNFSEDDVTEILKNMGYNLRKNYARRNLHYYLERTSHGSTLSRIVHAQLANDIRLPELSWTLYREALSSDYQDIQSGTTAEGIHTGVMAATLNTTIMAYAGVDIRHAFLRISPSLPEGWQCLRFNLQHRGIHYYFVISHKEIIISASKDTQVEIHHKKYAVISGVDFSYEYTEV
ncbi:glycoside hydrolase family 65 protein [Pectobacterium parmentieri]|uniref:Glycoside hydrolase family 65 protein n=1 Tax=Pectobacterium parmentieri TaxID=1905730 RepID=A0A0H3I2I8_PECPM|nr:glycosyl hydrolase family 65 protein [Pectobacterium parmentieri]AFI88792.1 Kojibiose phosphorylase [Pectobacterium parmentieri]MBI0470610.1 glycoside hydrolase family 65 protein [Pectobacterium parmentieri]MBI0493210.1 glycoside hydrolase family 65 protein [Pectobacterium parmentieri]MBI0554315.1 glycoside hydrolase family 65 protein [Pectobacterium parmentieri]MBI0567380.1 glycoside hydrolase family 65 protein [Pectobacterium parmentieri]